MLISALKCVFLCKAQTKLMRWLCSSLQNWRGVGESQQSWSVFTVQSFWMVTATGGITASLFWAQIERAGSHRPLSFKSQSVAGPDRSHTGGVFCCDVGGMSSAFADYCDYLQAGGAVLEGRGGGGLCHPSYTLTTCIVRHYISLRAMQCRDAAAYSWAFVSSPSGIAGKRREIRGFAGANLCSSGSLFITSKHIVTIQSSLERWQVRQSGGDEENETRTMEGAQAKNRERKKQRRKVWRDCNGWEGD